MRTGYPEDIVRGLRPGQRVYFQGGPGESELFHTALRDNPGLANGVEFWSCLIPGINRHDYGALPGTATLTTFMASPALEASIASGRTIVNAMPYSAIGETLSAMAFDVAILHTAPPDRAGKMSFGIACDMPALVWPNAERRIAIVNQQMPTIADADCIPEGEVTLAVPINEPLQAAATSPGRTTGALAEISRMAAQLVPDGATIQSGIGEAPAAVVAGLRLHRGLKVHSGIITPEYRALAESGAIDPGAENIAGVAWGDAEFYRWLSLSDFAFRSARVTHSHDTLAAIEGFVSIGSALEIDLEGNLNLEWLKGRRVSSVGGAPDYLRGAAASPGGMSIIALPATAGGASRIVPRLGSPSVPGSLVDVVVTEHGVARLKGLSPKERAKALIAVAAPEHRAFLQRSC
jgi:acyl-CoA hydrolase